MKIGISQFCLNQIKNGKSSLKKETPANSFVDYSYAQLIDDVHTNWYLRVPGIGREDLSKVVSVPILNLDSYRKKAFTESWIPIDDVIPNSFVSNVDKRADGEDSYVSTKAIGPTLENKFVNIILYSADTLLENNGDRSGDYDWEVVAIIASPWEKEPMMPLTMARNYLQKTGGTYAPYTAEQFAEAIYHWSRFVRLF